MAKKEGCTVEVVVNCYDENGNHISQTDTDWYGFDREMMNYAARDLIARVARATEDWENARRGTPTGEDRGRR